MLSSALVDRLAVHRTLGSAPREQLEWLADHGEFRRLVGGTALMRAGDPIDESTAVAALAAGCSVRALAGEIERAAARVHDLVAAVKGFTYMDQTTAPTPVNVARGLADTLAVLRSKANAKSIDLTLKVEPGLPRVQGFGGELNEVWGNLIDNAIDAATPGGQVRVSAARDGRYLVVRVVDNGAGIPDRIRNHLFEPFFTTKPIGQGTGLGLDIARRLVTEHEGGIEVDSQPGRTVFSVRLPAGDPGEERA